MALQGVATRPLNLDFCFFPSNVSLTLIHGFRITFEYRRMLMKNHKSTLPLSCSPTDSLCPLLSLLRHLLKSNVLFLRLFGGLEMHRKLVQPDTVGK